MVINNQGRTFSRSYGTILPSSFTRVLSSALVFSTCPPVSVCGTVLYKLWLAAFPGSRASMTSLCTEMPEPLRTSGLTENRICLVFPPTCKYQDNQRLAHLAFFVPTSPLIESPGILTWFPSTTHFCLALGADSPCSDERRAGNLGLSACGLFTRIIVTHVSIRTSDTSSRLLNPPSSAYRTLPYHAYLKVRIRSFGVWF